MLAALREVGVLAGLARCLAAAAVSVFAVSAFETDYLLVRCRDLARAREVLEAGGYRFPA